ncbi:hypothetical protein BDR07DRAFT_1402795, partial [Suillus spraguei]
TVEDTRGEILDVWSQTHLIVHRMKELMVSDRRLQRHGAVMDCGGVQNHQVGRG